VFEGLPRNHFGAILADPPWHFEVWSEKGTSRAASNHYPTQTAVCISDMPIAELAAKDCILFLWICWPMLQQALRVIDAWGFTYKTCAFSWMKARADQIDMFRDDADAEMLLGYWTRANSEVCLLATRGRPQRLNADVRQGIIAPRREHSRKPYCVYDRIERLVAGPYLELFARQQRSGWTSWGNETDKYDPEDDIRRSVEEGFKAIRERKANGGPGWPP
jgi:N6-adenosine-specific RNA methylase IME4